MSPDARISGLLQATASHGVVKLPPISVYVTPDKAEPFNVSVTLSSPSSAFPDITQNLTISFCPLGSFLNASTFSCQACVVGHW